MKALIIDDSRAMRKILKAIVEPLGFRAIEAEDGQVGLNKLYATPDIDLILVDWNMPIMTGIEFVKTVREHEDHKHQKIVMVTTETEPAQMARALMAGVDEFVMKPFTPETLLDRLRLIGVCPDPTSAA